MTSFDSLVAAARVKRASGQADAALQDYRAAAELAREHKTDVQLLFAQRHVADLALESGNAALAMSASAEAVRIAEALTGIAPLDHANALRVHALALTANAQAARHFWEGARQLYKDAGIAEGVAECEANLA